MALRRRRRPALDPEREKSADLGAPEHSWWADDIVDTPAEPSEGAQHDDPYELLKVDPSATWDEIVVSYRRLARWWHPDGLVDAAPGERELCEDMIRRLNVAYTELRVRRGR